MSKMPFPLKVDPAFFFMAKELIAKEPDLNMRKVTKKIADKKMIIGELFNNKQFEEQVNEIHKQMQKRFNL